MCWILDLIGFKNVFVRKLNLFILQWTPIETTTKSLLKDAKNMPHPAITVFSIVTKTQVCQAKIIGFTAQQTTLWIKVDYNIPYRTHLYSSLLK